MTSEGYKPLNDSIALEETGVAALPGYNQPPAGTGYDQPPMGSYNQAPPIVQPPVSIISPPGPGAFTTTTTIISQQPQGKRPWSSDICGCFDDMKSCCCTLFFGNFYLGCLAQRMGEHCCVGCCLGGLWPMRVAMRERHQIEGDICNDWCISLYCGLCAACQLAREMDRMGYPPENCC